MIRKQSLVLFLLLMTPQTNSGLDKNIQKIAMLIIAGVISSLMLRKYDVWSLFLQDIVSQLRGKIRRNEDTIKGNGIAASEDRSVDSFSTISFRVSGHLEIMQGDQEWVSITADSNILPYLTCRVIDQKLLVQMQPGHYSFNRSPHCFVTVKDLNTVVMHGTGTVILRKLIAHLLNLKCCGTTICQGLIKVDELKVIARDTSMIQLQGTAKQQSIDLEGTINYDAKNLKSDAITLKAEGANRLFLRAENKIQGSASGVTTIEAHGNRPLLDIKKSGIGVIKHKP